MRQKAKRNSEGRKLCDKNNNKYILEKEDNNDKELGNIQQQSIVKKENIRMRAKEMLVSRNICVCFYGNRE